MTAKSVSPYVFKKECILTDLISVSGLFPASKETNIDTHLIRQHLLQETRRELREILDGVPMIRRLYIRHCSSNTPAASRHIIPKKRVFPPMAYINVEPRKSESDESIDCVKSVTLLAGLNKNDRYTFARSTVCQQSKLLRVDREELLKNLTEKRKNYTTPPETYGINKMKEAVDNLYSLELELPFMKYLKVQDRIHRIARSKTPPKSYSDIIGMKPKKENLSRAFFKERMTFSKPKKENKEDEEKNTTSEPYMMGFFLGKSRTYPNVRVKRMPEIQVYSFQSHWRFSYYFFF